MFRSSLRVLLVLCGVAACGNLRVDPASPRPNVDLPSAMSPAAVTLAPGIPDQVVIPKTPSVNAVPVSGWRTTLTRAFENGFKGGSKERVLVLREAELTFGPAALGPGGTAAVRAHIRFKSTVADPSGNELIRIFGEVEARDAATVPTAEAMTANAAQATEAMYEQIAKKILHPDE